MKITKLTPEQAAQIPGWVKKWVDIGLSTEPADFEAATEAALKAYALCNLKKPMVVLRMGSPYAAIVGGAMAWKMLRSLIPSQVEAQVRAQVFDEAKKGLNNDGASNIGWAGYAAWVSFFRDVCGWRGDTLSKFEISESLVKSCGWTWWHENVLAISDRPHIIKRDNEGRLHCETGPSIAYRDGWTLHHWHGVSIPPEWVNGKKPSAKEALHWANVEQRRAACEILGWQHILAELDAKVIDKDDDAEIGTLLEVNLPDSGPERFLSVRCGTGRQFALPVPREVDTALAANAWTYGLDKHSFKPEIRT